MMRIDGKFRNLAESDAAFARIKSEFFDPYDGLLELSGADGVGQVWVGDRLAGLTFPTGYGANRGSLDVSAAQHEMGHFVTVRETNSVRREFGFGRGIPVLIGSDPNISMHVSAASAEVEAKAMAWEVILSRDLHNLDLDCGDISSSLVYTEDFLNYEGDTNRERLQWVTEKIIRYVEEFGTADDFRSIWHDRCSKLPDLFMRETIRTGLAEKEADQVMPVGEVKEGWVGSIEHRADETGTIGLYTVVIRRDNASEWDDAVYKDFDTLRMAERWIERVREGHGYEPDNAALKI